MTNAEIRAIYGEPGDVKNLVSLELPYPYLLDWDLTQSVNHITCHKLVKERLENIHKDIYNLYGPDQIHDLGINQFGGCFNMRPKRGCESAYTAAISRGDWDKAMELLSTHSWAVAEDKDPNRNLLRESHKTARFARPVYKDMIDIYYKHDFLSYGREKDFDWMHFEAAI